MPNSPRKRGAPPRIPHEGPATERIAVQVTADELARLKAAAPGGSPALWLRDLGNAAVLAASGRAMMDPVTISEVTVYRVHYAGGAYDDLPTREDAELRRMRIEAVDRANAVFDAGGTLLEAHVAAGPRLWFEVPAELHAVTKRHGFVIEHWQGSDFPAYSVQHIDYSGRVDVRGCGAGVYGETITLRELARYRHRQRAAEVDETPANNR